MISNIVYTANARRRLDLRSVVLLSLPQYRPPQGRFPGAFLKLPSATFLIFSSGKIVITGLKDEPDELEFELLTDIRLYDVTLSHCSGYMHVGEVSLMELYAKINKSVFEPELHPGLMFRLGKVSITVYHTGSIIYCGCRGVIHALEIENAVRELIDNS